MQVKKTTKIETIERFCVIILRLFGREFLFFEKRILRMIASTYLSCESLEDPSDFHTFIYHLSLMLDMMQLIFTEDPTSAENLASILDSPVLS